MGGAIGLAQEGGSATLDADASLLQLNVTAEALEQRRTAWTPHPPGYTRGILGKYAKLVSSSS